MSSPVEQIKEKLSIEEVISSYVKLERAGGNFRARCPFHNEKTPSFFVSPARGTYHCFGCNRGGDIFTFVEEFEGLDFRGALKTLAERAGVAIVPWNKNEGEGKEKLFKITEDATLFFQINLTKNKEALKYLYGRGLTPGTLKDFRLGFASDSWDSLLLYLLGRGYKEADIEKTGLILKGEKGTYHDRFRSRIMFPLSDSAGRVVGFSGRIFGKEDPNVGKYINSPETEIYQKSKILYGFDRAKQAIRKNDAVIFVEGQMDLLMSHQAGFIHTVAVSGTALTADHMKNVVRLTNRVFLALDSDTAGRNATWKSARLALLSGADVRVLDLPEGLDPADALKEGKDLWEKRVIGAQHAVLAAIESAKKEHKDERMFKMEASKKALPLLVSIQNKIDQTHFIQEVAKILGVEENALREEMGKVDLRDDVSVEQAVFVREIETRRTLLERHVVGLLFWQKDILGEEGEKKAQELLGDKLENYRKKKENEKEDLIFEAESYFGGSTNITQEWEIMTGLLTKEILKEERDKLKKELELAEENNDTGRQEEILKHYNDISKRIDSLQA